MIKPEILFLKQEDVIAAGLLDMKNILEVTEYTFKMLGEGKVLQPTKIFMGMPDSENWTSYGMSMPSYVGGEYDIAGFKWAAESVYNATQPGMPYGIDVVILSDPKTMYPKAILDGTITTAMRTSAAAGVCAKYNARKNSRVAALIGAGVIGRTMIMAIAESVPSLEEIRIVDLDIKKAEDLAKEFEGKYNVTPCSDAKKAIEDADVVVTETTSRKDFIPKAWLLKNATVIQMEAHAFEEEVLLTADKIVLDSWEQMTHLDGHLLKGLRESGKLTREQIIQVQELATGQRKGRENDDEFVFCGTAGMGSVDVAIAYKMYLSAREKGLGTKLTLWDDPLWV
ncbi:ornithine cyclodeaminase family protein [Bacilliculturomica massiliensis]|uniref:ornithine cyclodeaminase family protein n=1 Tax=Bacilliculturomica massiliensis TaxID=1917867 RepID=UPI00102F909D|nr:ornithine cyclodeaminase family protein [Bacilliculturomica massiliensis]